MELQHVKEIILRSDQNLKRSTSVEEPHTGNNLELDLTGLVESIGKPNCMDSSNPLTPNALFSSMYYSCFQESMQGKRKSDVAVFPKRDQSKERLRIAFTANGKREIRVYVFSKKQNKNEYMDENSAR